MVTQGWRAIERAVGHLVGGARTSPLADAIDVTIPPTDGHPGWAVEVKWTKAPTVAQIENWLTHNQSKADAKGYGNALIVKRKAGRGHPTPYLAIFPIEAEDKDA
jgi:hypothetical protein